MRIRVIILLYILCITACTTRYENKFNDSILWKVANERIGKTSYILGTAHILDTNDIKLPIRQIEQLINKCQYMYVELSIMNRSRAQRLIRNYNIVSKPESPNVLKSLQPKYRNIIDEMIQLSPELLKHKAYIARLKPQAIIWILTKPEIPEEIMAEMFHPDFYFEEVARNKNKKILSLETASEQFEIVFRPNLAFAEAILMLEELIENYPYEQNDIFKLYEEQDIAQLASIHTDTVMIRRNNNMARKLDIAMQDYSIFVTVGASHLSGENGILNLLAQKGYTIDPVSVELN